MSAAPEPAPQPSPQPTPSPPAPPPASPSLALSGAHDFVGAAGLAALAGGGLVLAPVTRGDVSEPDFLATAAGRLLVDVAVYSLRTTPVRGSWHSRALAVETRDVGWILLHASGTSATRIHDRSELDEPGSIRFLRPGDTVQLSSTSVTERFLLEFPATALSAASATEVRSARAVGIRPTAIAQALLAYLQSISVAEVPPASDDAHRAERVVVALLDQAIGAARPRSGAVSRGENTDESPSADAVVASAPAVERGAGTDAGSDAAPGSGADDETDAPIDEGTGTGIVSGSAAATAALDEQIHRRALDVIDGALREPGLDVAEVAARVGVSTRRLQRLFTRRGSSVSGEIRARRLDRIAALLRGNGTAAELAQHDARDGSRLAVAVGFTSADTARRAFHSRFGMTMTEYRDARPVAPVAPIAPTLPIVPTPPTA